MSVNQTATFNVSNSLLCGWQNSSLEISLECMKNTAIDYFVNNFLCILNFCYLWRNAMTKVLRYKKFHHQVEFFVLKKCFPTILGHKYLSFGHKYSQTLENFTINLL